jgi:hypothetical protein
MQSSQSICRFHPEESVPPDHGNRFYLPHGKEAPERGNSHMIEIIPDTDCLRYF